jgi:hypothetical protein
MYKPIKPFDSIKLRNVQTKWFLHFDKFTNLAFYTPTGSYLSGSALEREKDKKD